MTKNKKKIVQIKEFEELESANDLMHQKKSRKSKKLSKSNKVNNLLAIIVLLIGALVGSMLVDVAQIVQKSGFSDKAISSTDIVRHDGRTWVAYRDELVPTVIITDLPENCAECQDDELVTWMRYVIPTIAVEKVMASSERGRKMIAQYRIAQIPAVLFDASVTTTPFFAQAAPFFTQRDERYYLQTTKMGVAVGKWIRQPTRDDAIVVGASDAMTMVTVWSNFDCVGCRSVHRAMMAEVARDESVAYVWKYYPREPNDARGERAAMAVRCAHAQGKFAQYSEQLFTNKNQWRVRTTDTIFTTYARRVRGVDIAQFSQCLADNQFQDDIVREYTEADDFAIQITPTMMVDNIMSTPPASATQLREMVSTAQKNMQEKKN